VGLFLGVMGLVASFITLNSKLEIVVSKVEQHSGYTKRVQILEREHTLLKAVNTTQKQYWLRFEEVLRENTVALNNVNLTLVTMQADINFNKKAIEKLEKMNES
jgi:hypothetical protein